MNTKLKTKNNLNPDLVDKLHAWCDILEHKGKQQTYGNQNFYFWFNVGPKYTKIVRSDKDSKQDTVHAFVVNSNGDIYKPATWSAPYKDVRYNIYKEFDQLLNDCEWSGAYLYKR